MPAQMNISIVIHRKLNLNLNFLGCRKTVICCWFLVDFYTCSNIAVAHSSIWISLFLVLCTGTVQRGLICCHAIGCVVQTTPDHSVELKQDMIPAFWFWAPNYKTLCVGGWWQWNYCCSLFPILPGIAHYKQW